MFDAVGYIVVEVRVGLLSSAIRQCLLGGTATPSGSQGSVRTPKSRQHKSRRVAFSQPREGYIAH